MFAKKNPANFEKIHASNNCMFFFLMARRSSLAGLCTHLAKEKLWLSLGPLEFEVWSLLEDTVESQAI